MRARSKNCTTARVTTPAYHTHESRRSLSLRRLAALPAGPRVADCLCCSRAARDPVLPLLVGVGPRGDGRRGPPPHPWCREPQGQQQQKQAPRAARMLRQHQGQTAYTVYPVENYGFGAKAAREGKDKSAADRLARLKAKYDLEGTRRSVEAVFLVQKHNHPHVMLLQLGTQAFYRLPGGKLKPGEDEVEGLKRKLALYLWPDNPLLQSTWEVGECIGAWWRPNFDTVFYPYTPPHITKPKEAKKLFIVPLAEKARFGVPKNYKLIAVPLFELYDNFGRYGPVIASLPAMLSRFRLNVVGAPVKAPAAPAASASAASAAPVVAVVGAAKVVLAKPEAAAAFAAGSNNGQQQQQQQQQWPAAALPAPPSYGEEYEGVADGSRQS